MQLNDFQKLSDNEKADCLWDKGLPVGGFVLSDARFVLYQIDGFYVQAEYRNDFNEAVSLKCYDTRDLPEIYLSQINISGLKH